jgi:hypothetical protein
MATEMAPSTQPLAGALVENGWGAKFISIQRVQLALSLKIQSKFILIPPLLKFLWSTCFKEIII